MGITKKTRIRDDRDYIQKIKTFGKRGLPKRKREDRPKGKDRPISNSAELSKTVSETNGKIR